MLLAGIQAEFGLDPRLKHSGVTAWGAASLYPAANFQTSRSVGFSLTRFGTRFIQNTGGKASMEVTLRKVTTWQIFAAIFLLPLGIASLSLQPAFSQTKPAWQERWEKVLTEAKKEGTVVVLGPPGDLIRGAMTDGFKKAFPNINIEYS